MKVLDRIVDHLRQLVSIDDSQFSYSPGRGTTDAIFVQKQLQEKYIAANKRLVMAFVDLEKGSDGVPQKVIWWALRKFGVEEWIVRVVQGMYWHTSPAPVAQSTPSFLRAHLMTFRATPSKAFSRSTKAM